MDYYNYGECRLIRGAYYCGAMATAMPYKSMLDTKVRDLSQAPSPASHYLAPHPIIHPHSTHAHTVYPLTHFTEPRTRPLNISDLCRAGANLSESTGRCALRPGAWQADGPLQVRCL